jgi:hypothetical protein
MVVSPLLLRATLPKLELGGLIFETFPTDDKVCPKIDMMGQ